MGLAATKAVLKAGGPVARGGPALWAVRDAVDGPVSKGDAAAAFEEVTGDPWPWAPTAQEIAAHEAETSARYPAALYHADKASVTVKNEAQESRARAEGFMRDNEMPPKDWVAAWARETGATEEQQAVALKSVKNDTKRRRSA